MATTRLNVTRNRRNYLDIRVYHIRFHNEVHIDFTMAIGRYKGCGAGNPNCMIRPHSFRFLTMSYHAKTQFHSKIRAVITMQHRLCLSFFVNFIQNLKLPVFATVKTRHFHYNGYSDYIVETLIVV